ncbi:MAG: phosphatidylserine decarboxylase [Chloroflexota bacterium]
MKKYGRDRAWPFAEGGGPTILLVTAFLGLTLIGRLLWSGWFSALLFVVALFLWLLILYFFRDPHRPPPEPNVIVSPADGRVVAMVEEFEGRFLRQRVLRLSIFLAVTNVHVQRAPVSGRVALIEHRPGRFLQAFRPEASEVNEQLSMVVESPVGRILVKQVAGILARRCVNYARVGDELAAGQRYGLIRFGSRVDLFLPPTVQVLVSVGDEVYGGLTPLAKMRNDE